jgi:hypothetical protein
MPKRAAVAPSFSPLQDIKQFQRANAHVFPSEYSLRWFYRQHRKELIEAGAVVELGGRFLINGPVFAETAIAIGSKVASARGER